MTVAVSGLLALTGNLPGRSGPPEAATNLAAPWEFTAPVWADALGGDETLSTDRYATLAAWADPALTGADRAALTALSGKVLRADLTGAGRDAFAGYWPPVPATGVGAAVRCSQVAPLATSPASLATVSRPAGVSGYAKILLAYSGRCGTSSYTRQAPGIAFLYAARGPRGWAPVRSWDVPNPTAPTSNPQAAAEPQEWELAEFTACGSPTVLLRDRIIVVDAFTQMCAAARADGVILEVTAAYRTRADQAALFADAVKSYGSAAEARKWVAYADASTCTSRHCSGVALNVKPNSAAIGWLTATVGCATKGAVTAATTCAAGTTPVPRMARYGFAAPLPAIPGYLEFTLPVDRAGTDSASAALSAPDCNPQGVPVPSLVAAVFRCRLAREGVTGADQDRVVAEAVVVARCESGWNAAARAFAGRFATSPNPADGRRYTQSGVFMISAELADAGWVHGGAGALEDPVANVNAAASLWLATRGWEQFGCATGTVGGFESGPVLPGYGGPALPAWAARY